MRKRTFIALAGLAMLPFTAHAQGVDVKAAFIYVGPIGDAGWTYAHEQGRLEMAKLPFVKESTYIESVPEGADAARVIRSVANKGYNLIFTTSFGYMDPTLDVAKSFPKVTFLHCSGYKTSKNVGNYFGKIEQARYLSGIIAGSVTKSNTLGYIAAFPIPEVIRGINAFALGAQSVNPNAVVKVVWSNTWFDPGVERSAAESLLSVNCDVLAMHQDSPAPLQAAEKAGKFCMGYNTDTPSFAPNGYLCAPVWNWGVYYTEAAKKVHEGTWQPSADWWGIDTGMVDLGPMTAAVPDAVKALVEAKKKELVDGTFKLFSGPIKNQEGKEIVPAGAVMSDEDQLKMDFFVEGVQGSLSK